MANATMRKFGYPETLIRQWDHWAVLLRPAQVTLGSLVLADLERQGLIERSGREIAFRDWSELRRIASFQPAYLE